MIKDSSLIGVGLYSFSEAGRLTKIPVARIRRWIHGYNFSTDAGKKTMPGILHSKTLAELHDENIITFKDLLEVRFVEAFRKFGVSSITIRKAALVASKQYGLFYPFSSQKFRTDGKRIFNEITEEAGEKKLLDLVKGQYAFERVISASLKGLEFSVDGIAQRWFPLENSKSVVIDPNRSFGKPIVSQEGVPTHILFSAYKADKDLRFIARSYSVKPASLKAAIEFENRLAA